MLKKIFKIFKNRFILVSMIFFVWILAFDKNNLISQIELTRKLRQVQRNKKYFIEQIRQDQIETKGLLTNPENLEKFARERYLMKRDSEDIFLIVNEDSLTKNSN